MLAALDRKLLELGFPKSIKKDREFDECLQDLEGKARELRAAGMGKKTQQSKESNKGRRGSFMVKWCFGEKYSMRLN